MPRKGNLTPDQKQKLLRSARAARKNAYCPHSCFAVGAALFSASGKTYRGVNVENSSFGATVCAERSALLSAVSAGEREFRAIAIVAGDDEAPVPCGQCLQVLAEFVGPDFLFLLSTPSLQKVRSRRLKDLLPETFIFTS